MSDHFLSLARKWRPRRLADMVGQEYVVRALQNAAREERLHHALLFSGTRGIGKTTLARIVAMLLNCADRKAGDGGAIEPCLECDFCRDIMAGRLTDVIEQDAASHTQVDKMRELLDGTAYAPARAKYKVFIIDEVHMLTKQSFNAMLKTLEEPPAHVKFILATTDPQKLPATVRSRCLCFSLLPLTPAQIKARLGFILQEEGIAYADAAVATVARLAAGSMRDALSILDQAVAHRDGELQADDVRRITGDIGVDMLADILRALAAENAGAIAELTRQHIERHISFDSSLSKLAALLYKIALAQAVPDFSDADDDDERALIDEMKTVFSPEQLQVLYEIALAARRQLAIAPDGATGFCMALLRMMLFTPSVDGAAPAAATSSAPPAASAPPATSAPPQVTSSAPVASTAPPPVATAPPAPAAPAPVAPATNGATPAAAPVTNGATPAATNGATPAATNGATPTVTNGATNGASAPVAPAAIAAIATNSEAQQKWKETTQSLSGMAQALAMFCIARRYDAHGALLVADKSQAAAADKFLPALKEELTQKHGAAFELTLTIGEDNAADDTRKKEMIAMVSAGAFLRNAKGAYPNARLIESSVKSVEQ